MDDDDKIRRNLIVTSAIVIGVAWFDVSLPDLLERLFSIKSTTGASAVQVADWKVWVAALAMLVYMAWRYRWSDEFEKANELFQGTVALRYAVLFRRVYLRDVAEWFRKGVFPADAHPQMPVLYNQIIPQTYIDQIGRRPDAVSLSPSGRPDPTRGNESVEVRATWNDTGRGVQENGSAGFLFIDTGRQRALLRRSRVYAMLNSKESMSLLWPILFAVPAMSIAVFKLARSLI